MKSVSALTASPTETCILVGVSHAGQPKEKLEEYLDELEFLAMTAKAETTKRFTQALPRPDPKTFVGAGKLNEIASFAIENKTDIVIFDDELSPAQLRNIEQVLNPELFADHKIKVLDRSNLILDIFASRAGTAGAKKQVELAQYEYLLPRLTRMWTHLSKQKGGIGMKGPGETEIETDRRIVRDRIALLKKDLEKIDKQMHTQRSNRGALVRCALVGYTNAGKSTLLNLLSKSDVFAEDRLFATLDTTVRKTVIDNLPFLLADTVGFIRKLPHQLIESFKSTLDETRESDILLHVADVSHPSFEDHLQTVNRTLAEIGSGDKPRILVLNKTDRLVDQGVNAEDLKSTWMAAAKEHPVVCISATSKQNIEELRAVIYREADKVHRERYPHNAYLY